MAAVASTTAMITSTSLQRVGGGLVEAGPERAAGAVDAGGVDEDDLRVGLLVVEDAQDPVPGRVGP